MTFPKFNSGSIGRLGFETMNDVFARIEKLEQKTSSIDQATTTRGIFLARITETNANGYAAFVEVNFGNFPSQIPEDMTGGKTSTNGSNTFAYPAIGSSFSVGQIVTLIPTYTKDGKLVYKNLPESVESFPAKIISSSVIVADKQWKYTVQKASINQLPNSVVLSSYGPQMYAYNGCEWIDDTATIFGVGMESANSSATFRMVRRAIRGGVVICSPDVNGLLHFSVPNGYKVTC